VPWCEDCSKYLTPSTVKSDGTCPTCGRQVGEIERRADDAADDVPVPWHFKLLVVALVVYLGWRGIQLVGWLA
jgi:hypothetical protein